MKHKLKVIYIQPPCPKCDSSMEYKDWRRGKPYRLICPECGMVVVVRYKKRKKQDDKSKKISR